MTYGNELGAENIPLHPTLEPTATAQHLATLVFLSYRFSQGGIGIQSRLLGHLEETHPGLVTGSQAQHIEELASAMVSQYFLNDRLHPPMPYSWDEDPSETEPRSGEIAANDLAGVLSRFRDKKVREAYSSSLTAIAEGIIIMDADYLGRPGGRAGEPEKTGASEYTRDPYDSHFIRYGVLGTSTNTAEYDALFREITSEQTIRKLDKHAIRRLQTVIAIYNQKHPETVNDTRITHIDTLCMSVLHGL